MFHLVTGGSGSGKSAYAEDTICQCAKENAGELFYIATMRPFGEETKRKIQRHRSMRADKGFQTLECYTDLEQMAEQGSRECPAWETSVRPCVLLECMSNLTANEIYQPTEVRTDVTDRIIRGVVALKRRCAHLVIVTNEVCSECTEDSKEMQLYKQILAEINRKLAQMADVVTEVVYGIPCTLKGPLPGRKRNAERELAEVTDRTTYMAQAEETDQAAWARAKAMDQAAGMTQTGNRKDSEGGPHMRLVTGGAHQGKLEYAKKTLGNLEDADEKPVWVDGENCSFEAVFTCDGIYHFERLIRRMMKSGKDTDNLASSIAAANPGIVIVSTEIGCGLVPVDAFDREYREQTGRICTQLANFSPQVDRVVCGIALTLKGE